MGERIAAVALHVGAAWRAGLAWLRALPAVGADERPSGGRHRAMLARDRHPYPSLHITAAVLAQAGRVQAAARAATVRLVATRKARGTLEPVSQRVPDSPSAASEIYAVVRAIPRGKVATYGQVAELAGILNGHRVVARAMRQCPPGLPWQRVVGRKDVRRARISVQDPQHVALQRRLLEREGVRFDAAGFIVLARSGWLPG